MKSPAKFYTICNLLIVLTIVVLFTTHFLLGWFPAEKATGVMMMLSLLSAMLTIATGIHCRLDTIIARLPNGEESDEPEEAS